MTYPSRRMRAIGAIPTLHSMAEIVTTICIGGSWHTFQNDVWESPLSLDRRRIAENKHGESKCRRNRDLQNLFVLGQGAELLFQQAADLLARPVDAVDVHPQLFRHRGGRLFQQ